MYKSRRGGWIGGMLLALSVPVVFTACDFSPTNPGPVQDEFLNDRAAHDAVVTGASRQLSVALNRLANHVGAITQEHTPAGLVGGGAVGVPRRIRQGILNTEETVPHWNEAQEARWVAEDGVRRIQEVMEGEASSYRPFGRAHLYAGYANRLLGENMCRAVIDGGAAQDRADYFERAAAAFTSAQQVASAAGDAEAATVALAGRASVRVHLGDWSGAIQDAGAVPTDFQFQAMYFGGQEVESNVIWVASSEQERSISVWDTFYEDYFLETGDPRTAWDERPDFEFGGPAPEGQVLWFQQLKYTSLDAPINLSTGREMRLIEAENMLRNQEVEAAIELINELRIAAGAPTVSADSPDEAWALLKRERGIEMWLEARRLGDVRRWNADGTAGSEGVDPLLGESDCFPIPDSELETNPNL